MADAARDLIFDPWTPVSYKRVLGNKRTAGQSYLAPTWVGEHARRLQAYKILQSYVDNAARVWLQNSEASDVDAHREYGDAQLIVQTVLAALLGEDQQIVVDGADLWDPKKNEVVSDTEIAEDAKAAWELQEWLRQWATDERLALKMIETERNAVSLGDGVYTLGVNHEKERVRLRVYNPGFYFPVLDDGNEDEFPDKVHLAWELETGDPAKTVVRRITWELVELPGGETRNYDWNDKPSRFTVLMSDGTWEVDNSKPGTVEDFSESRATWATFTDSSGNEVEWRNLDLQQDFLPDIHLPNSVALSDHYGRSILATILQILDDLANADTDLQAASATTGKPPVALSGARVGKNSPTYRAGEIWELGPEGKLEVVDTSSALDALLKYVEALLKRMSTNARVPESVLGRVEISGQLAGITLALSFGPLGALVKEMRLVREEKYPLLLKFVWRMSRAAGWEGVPEKWFPAKVEFGSYLPQDTDAAVRMVADLLSTDPPGISIETAVRILVNGGLPIDDALEEVRRITGRDFKGATELLDATGDEAAVFDYLGRTAPATPVRPPAPSAPPTLPNQ